MLYFTGKDFQCKRNFKIRNNYTHCLVYGDNKITEDTQFPSQTPVIPQLSNTGLSQLHLPGKYLNKDQKNFASEQSENISKSTHLSALTILIQQFNGLLLRGHLGLLYTYLRNYANYHAEAPQKRKMSQLTSCDSYPGAGDTEKDDASTRI